MPTDVETLIEMGFSQNRAEKALSKTGYKGAQTAMEWLFAHDGDPDIDEPFVAPKGHSLGSTTEDTQQDATGGPPDATGASETAETEEARSLKCDDCGKLLKTTTDAEVHAHRSGHANFSESTEAIKPLTPEEKEAQMKRLQEKIKQKRVEREDKEKQEQLSREKARRTQGKGMTQAKQKLEELEMKKIVEQRRREKQDEKLARQRVRDQIEKDKRDRAAKFAKSGGDTDTARPSATQPAPVSPPQAEAAAKPAQEYEHTRLQIRLTNGQALTQSFGVKEPLSAVRVYITLNRTDGDGPFKLMTSFPRKEFSDLDMDKPLQLLGLVPSAVLIVTKAQ